MKRTIPAILTTLLFMMAFQACEEDPISSGIGPLYVIEITPDSASIDFEATIQFTAIGKDADMNVIPDLTFSWTSDSPSVGTIDENGLFSGLSTGITMITAKANDIESLHISVNVYDPVLSIVISPESLTLDYAATSSLTAIGKDIDDNVIAGLSFNWESENRDIASVDANGLITAVSAGTTTIIASLREVDSLPITVVIEMVLPSILTTSITEITDTTALAGGTLIHDGGGNLTAIGVCLSTVSTPTIADHCETTTVNVGSFSVDLTGLYPGTTYYARSYATNTKGTAYGDVKSFTTTSPPLPLSDIDGNVYNTIQIGDQVWMSENLRVTHYRNGDEIPTGYGDTEWYSLSTGAYANYNNDSSNVAIYGRLYNGHAVADIRNIAPEGWHIPTDAEWQELEMHLGLSQALAGEWGDRGSGEGSKLKSKTGWDGGGNGDNSSGFSALPGGYRDGLFIPYFGLGTMAMFWSSTVNGGEARLREISSTSSNIARRNYWLYYGFSVRCVRD